MRWITDYAIYLLDTEGRVSNWNRGAQRIKGYLPHEIIGRHAGLPLHPTELLIFGNAKAGTPLMQSHQTIGIDLPLKALAWEDSGGKVWLSYNDPAWLAVRHGLMTEGGDVIKIMAVALATLSKQAAGP